ncbi:transcriptional regulator [Acetobacter orientalis]|uniref:Transcriptional regulator n=1 Tax=Acetobacter orientalis TaxID=146474 RepID=A0A2Z5ZIA1_9PROT|nr:transcriptional regulator [Acetobacter orientalis]
MGLCNGVSLRSMSHTLIDAGVLMVNFFAISVLYWYFS